MNTPAAHTPGPWKVWDQDPMIVVDADGSSICDAEPGFPATGAEAQANARLIAESPALLTALQIMVARHPHGLNAMMDAVCNGARDVIARATGDAR